MSIELPSSSQRRLDGLRLLSICTSTAKASVFASSFEEAGRLSAGTVVFQDQGRESAAMIFQMIDQALAIANLSDFDLLAFDKGPGAFTGVRIGCGVAQGLGFGKSIPVVGVNALAALALHIARSRLAAQPDFANQTTLCGVAIDARMGEVYCAVYEFKLLQGYLQATMLEPTVCSSEQAVLLFENIRCNYAGKRLLVGGNGFDAVGLHQRLFEWASSSSAVNIEIVNASNLDAEKIALYAVAILETRLKESVPGMASIELLNESYPAALAAPEYVRNNVALDKAQQAQLRSQRNR
jgi:tRNA threonylcarbamoyladenosine biosynthesis protein TsaB